MWSSTSRAPIHPRSYLGSISSSIGVAYLYPNLWYYSWNTVQQGFCLAYYQLVSSQTSKLERCKNPSRDKKKLVIWKSSLFWIFWTRAGAVLARDCCEFRFHLFPAVGIIGCERRSASNPNLKCCDVEYEIRMGENWAFRASKLIS
jgi:hypothetical protein